MLTTLIYIKASPKIHKAKYDAYCPLYLDTQRTAEALLIRHITRDPLNVVASHQPVALPAVTVLDIEATQVPAAPSALTAAPVALLTTPTAVTGPHGSSANAIVAAAAAGPKRKRGRPRSTVLGKNAGEAQPAAATFQISLFGSESEKLVLMSDSVATVAREVKIHLPRVNKRQRAALIRMHESGEPMNSRLYQALNQVSRHIAHDDLAELCQRGILQAVGHGRGMRYWLPTESEKPVSIVAKQ